MKRHSHVDHMYIINISDSSACICGESGHIDANTRALAVQRQVPVFLKTREIMRITRYFPDPYLHGRRNQR